MSQGESVTAGRQRGIAGRVRDGDRVGGGLREWGGEQKWRNFRLDGRAELKTDLPA